MNSPSLKLLEKSINPNSPWKDDKLERQPIAGALTNIISDERNPLTISLNGGWGSGKTFILKRWQAQLTLNGFQAIYFNAWEDDYCGDPLVAIIGQLWHTLKGSDWQEAGNSVKESIKPFLINSGLNFIRTSTVGIVDLNQDSLNSVAEKAVDDYISERTNRDEIRKRLAEMAKKVAEATGHPMVFIIDELDRCRPTFSIELLERIKHIFEIPNLVFVLGIDRQQLAFSIQAVYGNIDVNGYLRRFFDMDFSLPEADTIAFSKVLMQRHNLTAYFQERSETAENEVHKKDYEALQELLPELCNSMKFSPREIEHLMRIFIIAAKNVEDGHRIYPILLSILLSLRVKNHDMYLRYVHGDCLVSEVLNYINPFFSDKINNSGYLTLQDRVDMTVYQTAFDGRYSDNEVEKQFDLLLEDLIVTEPEHLSERTKRMNKDKRIKFIQFYKRQVQNRSLPGGPPTKSTLAYLSEIIELAALITKQQEY